MRFCAEGMGGKERSEGGGGGWDDLEDEKLACINKHLGCESDLAGSGQPHQPMHVWISPPFTLVKKIWLESRGSW